ncbi:MAG: ATP-binding protein, partial [Candidatus Hadarchaeales archaeon]
KAEVFATVHDVCNLLVSIYYNSFLAMKDRAYLEEIQKASEKAISLLKALLLSQKPEPETINLNEFIHEKEGEILQVLGWGIELVLELAPNLRPIRAPRKHIEQILMNLVKNAKDAMPAGGQLFIKTENYPGEFVCLTVKDTGVGISPEVMEHIFDPFFTTKGRGVGLGLSVVKSIVNELGGWVEVESREGEGTAFHVCFVTQL